MTKNAATHPSPAPSSASQPADSRPALAPVIEINVRHIGRTPEPEKLTGNEAPEGWIKKIDRPREGKVWVGFFHLYVADPFGRVVRRKKEKTLGPATMPKHEAQQKLAEYIEEYTGRLIHQGESIESFAELWKAFSAVKAGSWGKKMREDMKYLFDRRALRLLACLRSAFRPGAMGLGNGRSSSCSDLSLRAEHGPRFVATPKAVGPRRWPSPL
jgi:hypothetical protein